MLRNLCGQKIYSTQETLQTVQQVGMMTSALEYRVPELFFTNENIKGMGISAIKALEQAMLQNQKVYTLSSQTPNAVLANLNINETAYTKRMEPRDIIAALSSLQSAQPR